MFAGEDLTSDSGVSESDTLGFKANEEIEAMKKDELLEYAALIGVEGLSESMRKEDILNAVLDYQNEIQDEMGGN